MGAYSAHNQGVLQRRMGGRLGSSGNMVPVEIFTAVARGVFAFIDSPGYFRNETINLRDSIGIGIYDSGVLVKWIDNPTPEAEVIKTYIYNGVTYTMSGREKLETAINNAHRTAMGKYSMIIFCALPYGFFVDKSLGDGGTSKRGKGWWSEGLIPEVKRLFINECALHKLPTTSYRYGRA